MDQALHSFSCPTGILDLSQWDATLGLDGVGVWLIWQGNLTVWKTPHQELLRTQTVTLGPFYLHPYLKVVCSTSCLKLLKEVMILGPEHQLCNKSKAWSWSLSDHHYEIPFSLCHNIPLSQNEYSWVTNTISIRWCSLWIRRFLIPLYIITREPTYLTFSWFMFNLWQSTGVYSQKAMYDKL